MPNRIYKIMLSISFIGLSGCMSSNIEEEWQCNIAQGKGCQTISEADAGGVSKPRYKYFANKINTNPKKTPTRTPEIIGEIYFNAFVDSEGNYHKGSTIYKLFKKSDWE